MHIGKVSQTTMIYNSEHNKDCKHLFIGKVQTNEEHLEIPGYKEIPVLDKDNRLVWIVSGFRLEELGIEEYNRQYFQDNEETKELLQIIWDIFLDEGEITGFPQEVEDNVNLDMEEEVKVFNQLENNLPSYEI